MLLLIISCPHLPVKAYSSQHGHRSSPPGEPLSLPFRHSTLHSEAGERIIHKDEGHFVLSSRNEKNNRKESETWQRIISLNASLPQIINDKVPQMSSISNNLQKLVTNFWWSLPLTLCLVPILFGPVTTPHFWKMVQVDYILDCPDAALVIGTFLASNLSYFLAGYQIFLELPPRRNRLCSYGALAGWIWAAGLVSTIFHAVQSMGQASLPYAEALCYVDHGIAGAAVFYFYHMCGLPNVHALALGMSGLLCLALPLRPGYAWLHSLWHVLSAAAAWTWTHQGKVARRKQLLMAVRERVIS